MAHAMARLLTEMGLRERVISEARERVIREFNNKALVRDLAQVYREEGIPVSGSELGESGKN